MTSSGLTCIRPDWQVSSRVHAFTTTRLGGVSKPPYNALNLGLHMGDESSDVVENRRRLIDDFCLPSLPVWLNQTHGTQVVEVSGTSQDTSEAVAILSADGSYTRKADTVLVVLTADCLPVVISDEMGSQVAVVHAGWRGLANGILSVAVQRFSKGSTLHAWLGPAIGADKFEVGEDVRHAFVNRCGSAAEHFAGGDGVGKYWADLYALARIDLHNAGIEHVTGGDYCTHTENEWFHSHRRDGRASGRMATLAWIA